MADEPEPKVTAAYRALGVEEPPRALDEAILAAAGRPARSWSARWAVPLSLAAVVVLSVVVTLRIQHEQPELATAPAAPAAAPPAPREAPTQALQPQVEDQVKPTAKAARKPEARQAEPKHFAEAQSERAPAPAASAAVAQAPAPPAASGELASRRDAETAAHAPRAAAALAKRAPAEAAPAAEPSAANLAAEAPERELERIARLRAEGRHAEADKALAEFRKRHPEYRIPEEMLKRVERR